MTTTYTAVQMLLPALALVTLTLCVWVLLVTIRPRAMIRANVPWQAARYIADLPELPGRARDVADNYNHLLEQPTIFYALVFFTFLIGNTEPVNMVLEWGYVVLRILHSVVQIWRNWVPLRFWTFLWSTVSLIGLVLSNLVWMAG